MNFHESLLLNWSMLTHWAGRFPSLPSESPYTSAQANKVDWQLLILMILEFSDDGIMSRHGTDAVCTMQVMSIVHTQFGSKLPKSLYPRHGEGLVGNPQPIIGSQNRCSG